MDAILNLVADQFPIVEVHCFDLSLTSGNRKKYRGLMKNGYLFPSVDGLWLLPDERAMPYMVEHGLITNTIELKEIIAVQTKGGKTRVEYFVIRKDITPFGKLKGFVEGEIVLLQATHEVIMGV